MWKLATYRLYLKAAELVPNALKLHKEQTKSEMKEREKQEVSSVFPTGLDRSLHGYSRSHASREARLERRMLRRDGVEGGMESL